MGTFSTFFQVTFQKRPGSLYPDPAANPENASSPPPPPALSIDTGRSLLRATDCFGLHFFFSSIRNAKHILRLTHTTVCTVIVKITSLILTRRPYDMACLPKEPSNYVRTARRRSPRLAWRGLRCRTLPPPLSSWGLCPVPGVCLCVLGQEQPACRPRAPTGSLCLLRHTPSVYPRKLLSSPPPILASWELVLCVPSSRASAFLPLG